eukprot:1139695-Pelagomonas_calceolata.AAC.2
MVSNCISWVGSGRPRPFARWFVCWTWGTLRHCIQRDGLGGRHSMIVVGGCFEVIVSFMGTPLSYGSLCVPLCGTMRISGICKSLFPGCWRGPMCVEGNGGLVGIQPLDFMLLCQGSVIEVFVRLMWRPGGFGDVPLKCEFNQFADKLQYAAKIN